MANHIDEKRLVELRTAAEVGIRMASLQPHTVHVKPDELAALVEEVYIARAQERPSADIACRVCGCTDDNCSGCIEKTGHACQWVERDLCSACVGMSVQSVARDLATKFVLPGVLLMMYDENGALHLGCTAVDHPIALPFVALAQSINIACERGLPGFAGVTRDQAIEIARRNAKAKPQSYYAEPFEPHEWVVDAIVEAGSTLPPIPAQCLHCGAAVEREAAREHVTTCSKSPLVQELQRVRAELATQYPVAMAARAAAEEGRDADVAIAEVRTVIRDIGNSTEAAKLEYLPARLRGGS